MAENAKAEIEAELRSVVESTKGGVPLRNVQGDFRSLTGNFIPFVKFGYPTLEAMLRAMPNVIRLERRDGELIVQAVENEATKHLTELISKQKPSKPRHISKPRRPIRNQNWKPLTPHRSHGNLPSRPPSRNSQRGLLRTPPTQPHYYYSNARPSLQPISTNVPYPPQGYHHHQYQHQHQQQQQHHHHHKQHQQQQHHDSQPGRPVLKTNPVPKSGLPASHAPPKTVPPVKSNFEVPPRFQKQPSIPARVSPILPTLDIKPLPDPLVSPTLSSPPFSPDAPEFIPRPQAPVSAYSPPHRSALSPGTSSPPPLIEPGLPWPNPRSNKELVDNYAFINGLKCVYRPFESKSSKKSKTTMWLSQLILDDQKFLSYPEEMNTREEANEEAAKRAVEKLKIHPDMISLPIVSTRIPAEKDLMIDQVREIVCESSQGAVHYHVQDQFRKRYKMRLPSNWLEMIENEEFFRIDRADETHFILFYEKSARSTPDLPRVELNGSAELQSPSAESSGSEELAYLPEALNLPETKEWDIFITHADNTANICFRLIDYADSFEDFAQEMEEYYNNQKNLESVKHPVCGVPYCVFVENSWHRVIVQNIDDDGLVHCDFPDVGDSMWLKPILVFELEKRFLDLPFQAFRCELAGLACFSNDTIVSEKLIQRVIGKALVAEPTDRDDENITLVLYDTSTDDDININKNLLEEIFADIIPVSLSQTGMLVEGLLGDVLTNGDIFLNISERSMMLLNKLMESVTDLFQLQRKETPVTKVAFTEMYSVFYNDKWHRAIPASELIIGDKVSMLLIDMGIQTDVFLTNICKLDGDTKVLSQFAPLAVRCRLNNISGEKSLQKFAKFKEKLEQLVPEGTTLLIKVANKTTENQLPVVDLFKRLETNNNQLVSINQTLVLCFAFDEDEKEKVNNHVERKLSRPNSLQATSPPPISPSVFSNEPSSPSAALSPSASYSFIENSSPLFCDKLSSYPLDMVSQSKPLSSFGNTSPSVIVPETPVVTTPLAPGSAGVMLNTKEVFTFTPMQETLLSLTPPSVELEISRQEDIPEIGDYFDVFITSAANPNNFICQSRNSCNALATLFDDMQKFYNCEDNICEMHQCLVRVGEFFALKHKDECWYRVCVQEIILDDPFTMLVSLVDYGGFEMAKLSDVQVLYSQFRKLPYQAISASLAGVQPVSGDYSPSNCLDFKKMVEEKNFVSIIRGKEARKTQNLEGTHLSLLLVDTSTPVDVYIHEDLVKMNISKMV